MNTNPTTAVTYQIRWEGGLMATVATAVEAFALIESWTNPDDYYSEDMIVYRVENGKFRSVPAPV
jgi:hypothetical protein